MNAINRNAAILHTRRTIDAIYRSPGLHWVGDGFRVAGYFSGIPTEDSR